MSKKSCPFNVAYRCIKMDKTSWTSILASQYVYLHPLSCMYSLYFVYFFFINTVMFYFIRIINIIQPTERFRICVHFISYKTCSRPSLRFIVWPDFWSGIRSDIWPDIQCPDRCIRLSGPFLWIWYSPKCMHGGV